VLAEIAKRPAALGSGDFHGAFPPAHTLSAQRTPLEQVKGAAHNLNFAPRAELFLQQFNASRIGFLQHQRDTHADLLVYISVYIWKYI
jgi:hypothetical protein